MSCKLFFRWDKALCTLSGKDRELLSLLGKLTGTFIYDKEEYV